MANFWIHVFLVATCIGLGYVLRIVVENMGALDAQIKRMANPEKPIPYVSTYKSTITPQAATKPTPTVPQAMSEVKLAADPNKVAQLKAAIKG